MKKLLALALALSMSTTTFAGTVGASGGTQNIDVNAHYVDSIDSPTVYKVDVSWGAMAFTYTVDGTKTWDPGTHKYTSDTSGTWTESGNTITVTNHSNTGIKAGFSYAQETGYKNITGIFSPESITLPTAEGRSVNASMLTGKTEFRLDGTLANTITDPTKVGTITVTISKS